MATLLLDLRYAWRRLAGAPSFAIIAISTLAVGIGVTTAVYSLVYAMMFRPMNISDIERVVNIYHSSVTSGPGSSLSWDDYHDLKAAQGVFDQTTAWARIRVPVSGAGPAEMILGEAVEGTYFAMLGVPAAIGRTITEREDTAAIAPVAVVSDAFWRSRFGADPAVVGRVIKLAGHQVEIIGVAPPWFRGVDMPNVSPAAVWVPLAHSALLIDRTDVASRADRGRRWLNIKARLSDGRTVEEARAEVARIGQQLDAAFPASVPLTGGMTRSRAGWRVAPASSVHMGESIDHVGVPISYGVMAALALVLLIACVNIANLLLARAASRRVEMATRIAIGASRGRLLRQLLTENAFVCAIGGSLGIVIAFVLTRFMTMEFNVGRGFAFAFEPRIEWPVLLVALSATALAGLTFGLAPAVQGARTDVRAAMAGAITSRARRIPARRMLVIFQLGLSVAFLAVGSVFMQGFIRYAAHDPGFDLSRTAMATFELDFRWKDDREAGRRFLRKVRDAAREQPGTIAAAIVSAMPIGNPGPTTVSAGLEAADLRTSDMGTPAPGLLVTGPEALVVFGIPLTRGRFFDERDAAGAPLVAVVSESTARWIFKTTDVVGRRVRLLPPRYSGEAAPDQMLATIVGVTANTDVGNLGGRGSLMFVPFEQFRQFDARPFMVAVRTSDDPAAAASALSVLAPQVDDEVMTYVSTGPSLLANDVVPTRIGAGLTGGLGGLAFLLAIVGLYGVMSHLVATRTREIGIRMALGAEAARVVRLILREGAGVVIAGAIFGVLLAYWIVASLRRFIFGLDGQEPIVLLAVTAVLAAVALVACLIPARRAARVDPNVALRHL
jgi:predicted permease